MTKEVVIKSNKYGMELILSDQLPFQELLQIIGEKFRESGNFFKNAKMAVSFSGRVLSTEEEIKIVDVIMANSDIQIVSIMDQGGLQEERMKNRLEAAADAAGIPRRRTARRAQTTAATEEGEVPQGKGSDAPVKKPESVRSTKVSSEKTHLTHAEKASAVDLQGGFYKGNLRSGQVLECPASVTLIGDVNPGARIESAGNVVVLGALKGNACAGMNGDSSCFIFALDMQPIQLQIGDVIAKSPDKVKDSRHLFKKEKAVQGAYSPQIAVAREGTIYVEPMTKGCLDKL